MTKKPFDENCQRPYETSPVGIDYVGESPILTPEMKAAAQSHLKQLGLSEAFSNIQLEQGMRSAHTRTAMGMPDHIESRLNKLLDYQANRQSEIDASKETYQSIMHVPLVNLGAAIVIRGQENQMDRDIATTSSILQRNNVHESLSNPEALKQEINERLACKKGRER